MIKVTIRQEAERRGIKSSYGLARELGVGPSMAARLWKGKELPKLETIDKICTLWNCDLGALISCVPDRSAAKKSERKR